jgi:hypothetical protein
MKFEFKLSQRWSSSRPNARALIRQAIKKHTRDASTLKPSNYHRYKKGYFSISHTDGLGGYLLAPVPSGIDIEDQNRTVTDRVFKRFTTPQERSLGFSPLEAWVAKEAAFKALTAHYPVKTITEIRLTQRSQKNIKSVTEFSFKLNKNSMLGKRGRGFLTPHGRFLLGFASILP